VPNSTLHPPAKPALLFDWGDTLMHVFPQYLGPMYTWPHVEAIPYALETLTVLHATYTICLATNASDSQESEVRLALARVGLDNYLEHIYCYRKVGVKKPHPEFFAFILEDLSLSPSQAVMIGDDYDADILGALQSGLHAVWLNPHPATHPHHPRLQLIPDLSHLPTALQILFPS
jgi:FMN phosphatase YigB (HAD superfamily)